MFNQRLFFILLLAISIIVVDGYASKDKDQKTTITKVNLPVRSTYKNKPYQRIHARLPRLRVGMRIPKSAFKKLMPEPYTAELINFGGDVNWKGDLNSDGIDDYVALTGSSGSDAAEYMILASGEKGEHEKVFQEYTQEYKIENNPHSKWKRFVTVEYMRNERQICPETSNGAYMFKYFTIHEFDGRSYQPVRAWKEITNPPCM